MSVNYFKYFGLTFLPRFPGHLGSGVSWKYFQVFIFKLERLKQTGLIEKQWNFIWRFKNPTNLWVFAEDLHKGSYAR